MIGTSIDRFRILGRIGQGGMGSVWRAEDTLLHRPVALKLLAEDLAASPAARARFLREARAAASLSHPHVAAVYGAGVSEPHVFIALALIEGETVAECAARAPFEIHDAIRLGIAVAEALGHAHSRGVIHRDVTSRNIMLDRNGRVFVLDFGLALMVDHTRLTSTMTSMGTAAYMAPEAVLGTDAGPGADLYGLGVVLYETLTGTLPFRHERPEALLYAAVHEAPEPPGLRRPGLPRELEAIVMRLLEKSSEARHPNADALIADLRAVPGYAPGARVDHALIASGTRASAVSVRDRALAVVPFRDQSGDDAPPAAGALAAGLSDVVHAALARAPGLEVIPLQGTEGTHDAALARQQARAIGARMMLGGSVRRLGARVRLAYTLMDVTTGTTVAGETIDGVADEVFDLEDRLIRSLLAALDAGSRPTATGRKPHDPAAHRSYVQALAALRRTDDPASVDAAIERLESLRDTQPDSATIYSALGRAYGIKYALRAGREWEIRAAEACQRALELDPHAPEVFVTLGELHLSTGRSDESVRAFEQAIEIRPEYPEAWSGLSLALLRANRFEDAEEACRRTIALRPNDWLGYNRLGLVLFRQGRFEAAAEPWRMATRLAPDNSLVHLNLAGAYFNTDRWDEAEVQYRRSLEIKPTSGAWAGLGSVLYYRGEVAAALDAFEQAVALDPDDARMWGNLANACDLLPGQEVRGAEALDRAIDLMLDHLEINPNLAEDWALLAKWRADRRQVEPAVKAIERALALSPEDASVMGEAIVVYHTLGDRLAALHWTGEAVSRGYGVEVLRRNPALAGLVADPEFARVIETRSATAGREQHDHPPKGSP